MQRFAEYQDLKELYNRVMPEIVKFEDKIIQFNLELDQNRAIIRQFDENLTKKSDKAILLETINHH